MKAKLILKHRGDNNYFLISRTNNSEALYASLNPDGEFEQKLSKQNCDEIFGVIDVEKLAEEVFGPWTSFLDLKRGFITGYFKAKQTYKYTEIDLRKAMNFVFDRLMVVEQFEPLWINEFIQSLQQPTEVEVEIEMKNSRTGKVIKSEADLEWNEDGLCDRAIPKLDSQGCLVLRKL